MAVLSIDKIETSELESLGFWHDTLFDRWFFPPSVIGRSFFLKYESVESNCIPRECWYIFLHGGSSDSFMRVVRNIEQLNNFHKGICDKNLI